MDATFVRICPEPAWIFDRESLCIVEVNDFALRMFEYDRAGFVGQPITKFRRPEDVGRVRAAVDSITDESVNSGQWNFVTGTGRGITVEVKWMPTEYRGRPAVMGWAREVTEIVAAQKELARANQLLAMASRVAELGSWTIDFATSSTVWSAEINRILERQGDLVLTWDDVLLHFAPDFRQSAAMAYAAFATHGTTLDETVQVITATGKLLWARIVGEAVRDVSGRIVGGQGAFQNIDNLVKEHDRADMLARRLTLVMETSELGFMTLDRDLQVTFCNQRAAAIFRESGSAVDGPDLSSHAPPDQAAAFAAAAAKAAKTQTSQIIECELVKLNAWYRILFSPTAQDIAVYLRDVTEERRHATQLRLLKAAVDTQYDMLEITEVTADQIDSRRFIYVNPAFEQTTGYSAQEVLGKSPQLHVGPLTDREGMAQIRRAKDAGQPTFSEIIHHRKDGNPYWKELGSHPIRDAQGKVTHWVTTSRDITRRKEAEAALQLSNERFNLVAKATHELLWDLDLRTDVTWWNEAFLAFTGYPREASGGHINDWFSVIHPDDNDRVEAAWLATLRSTSEIWEGDYRLRRADGSYATVRDRAYITRDETGRAVRAVGSMTDVTEQLEMAERLRQSQKLEAFRQMTGGVAHDFNNLLTVILGNSELLVETAEPGSRLARLSGGILEAAERGAELTSQLLSYTSQKAMKPKLVNLNDLLTSFVAELRKMLHADATLQLTTAADLWLTEVDAKQFQIAIRHLTENAGEAMPKDGTFRLETSNCHLSRPLHDGAEVIQPGDYVCVTVSDTGSGIQPELVARIFEPYFTTKPVGAGPGLGLSMVYGFVKQSLGHLQVSSEQGKGSTFRLFFPRSDAIEGLAPALDETGTDAPQKAHILMVEDDPMVATFVLAQLRQMGYRVTSASNGREALLRVAEDDDIDLLFSDVMMPGGMNGRDLAKEVARLRPRIKILLTSGFTDNAVFRDGKVEAGMNFLGKPYRRVELAETLQRVLKA
jgi:PAS domain S-box-containing protein